MSGEATNNGPDQESSTLGSQTKPDRGPSPVRATRSTSAIPQLNRSRKNSQEFSPTRNNLFSNNLSTIPSAAAVQRALSAQRPIVAPHSVDGVLENARQDKTPRSGQNSPAWPTSPRLKSPPPPITGTRNNNSSTKKSENEQTPNTSLKRQNTAPALDTATTVKAAESTTQQSGGLRVPPRSTPNSTLETVAESSVPSTPSIGPAPSRVPDSKIDSKPLDTDQASVASTNKDGDGSGDGDAKHNLKNVESSKKGRAPSSTRPTPTPNLAKRSLTSLTPKPKPPEPPRTMTVETEPVASMPQLLGDRGLSGRDGSGSVRTKPSNETIRPKKEKKKNVRKATSLHSGTATSKADLFEAKVASAVDEADTSDSDETFVYESNPPDSRGNHQHSRTPSATSLAGQDQLGRNRHGSRSDSHAIGGKKSMKFSNSAYNNHLGDEAGERRGSVRTTTPRHHHIGRHGKVAHQSILDTNSPFTQANKPNSPRSATPNTTRLSRPDSPRVSNGRISSSPKKANGFDIYDDVADDERTPLMGSVRVNRTRHSRRPYGSGLRNSEYFGEEEEERGHCSRWASCMILWLVVLVICIGVATFVVGLNQPLLNVKVRHLQNILASEQELMLDLHVDAANSNLFAITVNDLDVNVFAESVYVGSAIDWEKHHRHLRWGLRDPDHGVSTTSWPWPPFGADDGVDEGTDPIDDPESPAQKMLLGRILEFDSPLIFAASPLRRSKSSSVGEIRLPKPGNKTEIGGSQRWERVLQHPFELIVRGVIRYQLPLSSKTRSVKIASRAKVYPDDNNESTPGNDTTTSLLH